MNYQLLSINSKKKNNFSKSSATSYFLNLVSQSFSPGNLSLPLQLLEAAQFPPKKILLSAQPFAKLLVLEKIKKDSSFSFFSTIFLISLRIDTVLSLLHDGYDIDYCKE